MPSRRLGAIIGAVVIVVGGGVAIFALSGGSKTPTPSNQSTTTTYGGSPITYKTPPTTTPNAAPQVGTNEAVFVGIRVASEVGVLLNGHGAVTQKIVNEAITKVPSAVGATATVSGGVAIVKAQVTVANKPYYACVTFSAGSLSTGAKVIHCP